MKNNIMKFLSVLVFTLGPVILALAQPLPPAPGPAGGPVGAQPLNCAPVPIENGYWILLALSFGYGLYKTWQMRKAEKTTE